MESNSSVVPPSSLSSTGSFLIRAPLTIDTDSDFESTGDYSGVESSNYGSESEEYVSGGEEFETASERPYLAVESDEENGVSGKPNLPRAILVDSDNDSVESAESVESLVADGEGIQESDVVVEDLDKKPNPFAPVAQLSVEDEGDGDLGDEEMVSDVEIGEFSGVVMVPDSVKNLPRIDDVLMVEGVELEEPSNTAFVVDFSSDGVENRSLENSVVDDESHRDVSKAYLENPLESEEEKLKLEELSYSALVDQVSSSNGVENRGLENYVVDDENLLESEEEKLKLERDEYGVADAVENVAIDDDDKIEQLESRTEPEIGLEAELHEPLASTEVESREDMVEDNGIQSLQPSESSQAFLPPEVVDTEKDGMAEGTGQGDVLSTTNALPSDEIQTAEPSNVLQQVLAEDVVDIEDSESGDQTEITEADISENSNQMEGEKVFPSDNDVEELIFGTVNQKVDQGLASPSYSAVDSRDHSETADMEGEGEELIDSAALTAFLKAAASAETDGGSIKITSKDGSEPSSLELSDHSASSIQTSNDEEKKIIEKIQLLKVKFLRLVRRLGPFVNDSLVAQVLYRLALAARGHSSPDFSLESAKEAAIKLEAERGEDLGFTLNILVLGKTGVGKSATINSILCEEKARVDAFKPGTTSVKEIVGNVNGVKLRIFDTPGLRSPATGEAANRKILASIEKLMRKYPPDVVLYVDRLDTNARDISDLPLLKSVTGALGSSIWQNTIITLTHAASTLPDGPSGSPISYDVFVAQKSHVVQQALSQAVGNLRLMNPSMANPVSLVENNPSYLKEIDGESMLRGGKSWRPHLLLLCYSLKILSEATAIVKPQDPFDFQKLLGLQLRSPPLPYFLSSLLQSRAHPKLSGDHDDVDSDIELGHLSDSDEEDEDEFDHLPPFKPLGRSQVANLSKEQRKAYFDEYDYRVKLLQKKQWRDEVRRLRVMKKKGRTIEINEIYAGDEEDQDEGPATVPVPLPDMILPPSFDGDCPGYRYRALGGSASQLLVRPVLDSHGWDHDIGYDGVSIERNLVIAGRFPGAVAVQITKDKKEFNIHLDSSVSAKTGEKGSTMAGFDIQAVGSQLAYIFRGETKFKVLKTNKMTTGLSVTRLGENVATGFKIEDQVALGKRLLLSTSAGTMRSQGENAYGANMEFRLNDKNFPVEQDQTTLGLSLMKWRNDLAVMANLQSQFSIGRDSKMAVRVGLNNKQSGQITFKISSSENLQIALSALLPVAISIFRNFYPGTDA